MKSYQYEFEKNKNKKIRNQEVSTVKEAVADLIDFYKLKKKFTELDVADTWRTVMGESVARRTISIDLRNRKLYLKLESAPLKNELMMSKSTIVQKINKSVGEDVLDDLVFS
jgi:hypothetical protein